MLFANRVELLSNSSSHATQRHMERPLKKASFRCTFEALGPSKSMCRSHQAAVVELGHRVPEQVPKVENERFLAAVTRWAPRSLWIGTTVGSSVLRPDVRTEAWER